MDEGIRHAYISTCPKIGKIKGIYGIEREFERYYLRLMSELDE